jgi:hypothetical protein
MELPLTTEKLIQMTEQIRAERETNLHRAVRGGVSRPEYILERLQRDVQEAIERHSGQRHYSYTLVSYNDLHKRFGEEDVKKAALEMGKEYMATHFPAATSVTINYEYGICGSTHLGMLVNIHFTLPESSDQTSSHLGQPT